MDKLALDFLNVMEDKSGMSILSLVNAETTSTKEETFALISQCVQEAKSSSTTVVSAPITTSGTDKAAPSLLVSEIKSGLDRTVFALQDFTSTELCALNASMDKHGTQQQLLANVTQDTNGMDNSAKEPTNVPQTESGILLMNNVCAQKTTTGVAMLVCQFPPVKEINFGIET